MEERSVQHILVEYIRRHAPQTLADESEKLRTHYGRLLSAARGARERRRIAREYSQARAAMVIRIAREVKPLLDL